MFCDHVFSSSLVRAGAIIFIFAGICLTYASCNQKQAEVPDQPAGKSPDSTAHGFIGSESCRACHPGQWQAWKNSHHDYSMRKPSEQTVRGDFSGVRFRDGEDNYRFFRRGEAYMVEASGPEGEPSTYEVAYTFGWEPLQQYLVRTEKGKLQALHTAWDTEQKKWFSLYPDQQFAPDDWLHWRGGAMTWNTMCADCHSTNVRQNFIPEADSFHTTYSSINVSCEACHGPGRKHAGYMQKLDKKTADTAEATFHINLPASPSQQAEISTCASCHSLRQKLTNRYPHDGSYLDHYDPQLPHLPNYFADGQIKGEVYVYGSFLQSRMYSEGIQCSDCHEPHSLELKANLTDNSLCLQCHQPANYNIREHHFHEMNTEASQCINCHMTGRYYMQIDFRRDHSFRVPRPDLSVKYNTPNACNNCHEDRSAEWAAAAVEKWYGKQRPEHFSEVLVRADSEGAAAGKELEVLIADTSQPAIIRATGIWYLGQFRRQASIPLLEKMVASESPLIRKSAGQAMAMISGDQPRPALLDLLSDSLRAVRLAGIQGLVGRSTSEFLTARRKQFRQALAEYRQFLQVSGYFPQGQMNRGQFYEQQGEPEQAIAAYQKALERDPYFTPARLNLAMLYNRRGENDKAEKLLRQILSREPESGQALYSLALLLAEQKKLEQALPYFEKAARALPQNGRVRYNQAIALQTLGQPENAETAYKAALRLEPENADYLYGLLTLYYQQQQYRKALSYAERLAELLPGNRRVRRLETAIREKLKR